MGYCSHPERSQAVPKQADIRQEKRNILQLSSVEQRKIVALRVASSQDQAQLVNESSRHAIALQHHLSTPSCTGHGLSQQIYTFCQAWT